MHPLIKTQTTSRRRALQALAVGLTAPAARGQGSAPAGLGAAAAAGPGSQAATLELGQSLKLPPITLLSGEKLEPSYFAGQTTVLYWWASWCPFCREQTPEMQKLWLAHAAQGLRLLGISIDAKAEAARQHWQRGGFTFPIALYGDDLARVLVRPRGVPVTVVIDRRSRVAQIERGQMFPEDVAALARWL